MRRRPDLKNQNEVMLSAAILNTHITRSPPSFWGKRETSTLITRSKQDDFESIIKDTDLINVLKLNLFVKKNDTNFAFQFCRVPKYTEFCSTILIIKLIFIFKNKNVPN